MDGLKRSFDDSSRPGDKQGHERAIADGSGFAGISGGHPVKPVRGQEREHGKNAPFEGIPLAQKVHSPIPEDTVRPSAKGEHLKHASIQRGETSQRTQQQDTPLYTSQQLEEIVRTQTERATRPEGFRGLWDAVQWLYQQGRYSEMPRYTQSLSEYFVTDAGNTIGRIVLTEEELRFQDPLTEADIQWFQADADRFLKEHGLYDKVRQLDRPGQEYNCFGFTFLAGADWMPNQEDVQRILQDNGYQITAQPQPGDLIVYRRPRSNAITHTGLVSKTTSFSNEIQITEAISKWSNMGLYIHAPSAVPPSYGQWQIYHSNRPGGSLLTPRSLVGRIKQKSGG